MNKSGERNSLSFRRSRFVYLFVVLIWVVFLGRLFYLQIIKHDYYSSLAVDSQERKFEIDAKRGVISIMDRDEVRPLVLNENLPTVFADPRFIDDKEDTAVRLAEILNGKSTNYIVLLDRDTAYVPIKKKVSLSIAQEIVDAEIKGVGVIDQYYRSYPESSLASQVLGFVNSDGEGQYGIEEYSNDDLQGIDGQVRATTDVHGIPLRGDDSNVLKDAIDGNSIILTLDINIQKQVEKELKQAVKEGSAKSGAVIVMDPKTGAVKAMANYPTFNPKKFSDVKDFSFFQNSVVSSPYEVGSVAKALTMSTGLNEGAVTPNSTYFDSGIVEVDGWEIENAGSGPGNVTRTMSEVIQKSVNTGIVHVLKQLGGGNINKKARETLYEYFTDHFGIGSITGIEQASEVKGQIFEPTTTDGPNIRYANMTFGQGMTTTMIQIASAMSSIINDGQYYKPYLIHSQTSADGSDLVTQPTLVRENTVSEKTSRQIRTMLKSVVDDGGGRSAQKSGYIIGGKTGTAQVPLPDGTYSETREIGSFAGFIQGGDGIEYVIMTRVDEPRGYLFAGSGAAAPLFADIAHWLIDYDRIPPVD